MIKKIDNDTPMLLTDSPVNVPLIVSSIDAGREAQGRLTSMGILPGEKLILLRRDSRGPILLEVKGTRVAIGRGLGMKVLVTNNGSE